MNDLENRNEHIEDLIHAYLVGSISHEEKDSLFEWLVQKPENVTHFNQISDIWLSSSVFQDTENFNENEAFNRVKNRISYVNNSFAETNTRSARFTWVKIAAILIPTIIITVLATKIISSEKPVYSETPFIFEVPYGSKATIELPDKSKVVLNAGSKIYCKEGFGKSHRNLKLVGEGYFTVAKNKDLPFIVNAGNLNVKALGTEFNVKAYPEDSNIQAVLIHGSIQINKDNSKENNTSVVLKPKQSLIYNKKTDFFQVNISTKKDSSTKVESLSVTPSPKLIITKTEIDPTIFTTWKEGSWVIYQQELSDLATELERKYDVQVQFRNESLKKIKVTGTLPNISLEQVLAAIRLISPIEFKINGKQVELTENKDLLPLYKKYYRNAENN
jgi:ferric-dicitrate binding protein FerR (iron transport regulator)